MSIRVRQGGFTLVEVVLVLAITAGAIAGAVAVRSSISRDISFSTAIEQVKNQIIAAKNESIQTVKDGSDGNGASNSDVFGRVVEFLPDDPATPAQENRSMRVSTLITNIVPNSADPGINRRMAKCDTKNVDYKDGVEYRGANRQAIVFQRDPDRIFVPPADYNENDGVLCSALSSSYGSGALNPGSYDNDNDGVPNVDDACVDTPGPAPTGCPGGGPPPDGCSVSGYVCGLYGQFYDRLPADAGGVPTYSEAARLSDRRSAFNGEVISGPYTNPATWLPILRYRAKNPASQVSVKWTGQILIRSGGPTRVCLHSDDGSYMSIGTGGSRVSYAYYNKMDEEPNSCLTVAAPPTDTWTDITIEYPQRDAVESTPFVHLVYKDVSSGAETSVSINDLRTVPGEVIWPNTSFDYGALRGEYYKGNNLDSGGGIYTSTRTDQNNGRPPFLQSPIFETMLRDYAGLSSLTDRSSVRWTGQIYVSSANPTYCMNIDDGARLVIAGIPVFDETSNTAKGKSMCAATTFTTGWKNLTIEFMRNTGDPNKGLQLREGGHRPTVRRSLDATANVNTSRWMDSKYIGGSNCSDLDNFQTISQTFTGLWPSNNYKLDVHYKNDPNGSLDVPAWYGAYQVCVSVNGTFINGDKPIDFPIERGQEFRTTTLKNISADGNGRMELEFKWTNDSWLPGVYDSNFLLRSIDVFRDFDSNGVLVSQADAPSGQSSKVAAKSGGSPVKGDKLLVGLLRHLSAPAFAQIATCTGGSDECSILIYNNYNDSGAGSFPFFPDSADFLFGRTGETNTGTIHVDPSENSITREIEL